MLMRTNTSFFFCCLTVNTKPQLCWKQAQKALYCHSDFTVKTGTSTNGGRSACLQLPYTQLEYHAGYFVSFVLACCLCICLKRAYVLAAEELILSPMQFTVCHHILILSSCTKKIIMSTSPLLKSCKLFHQLTPPWMQLIITGVELFICILCMID